jgi:hypothetical protein
MVHVCIIYYIYIFIFSESYAYVCYVVVSEFLQSQSPARENRYFPPPPHHVTADVIAAPAVEREREKIGWSERERESVSLRVVRSHVI